jgi:hypothetical protein
LIKTLYVLGLGLVLVLGIGLGQGLRLVLGRYLGLALGLHIFKVVRMNAALLRAGVNQSPVTSGSWSVSVSRSGPWPGDMSRCRSAYGLGYCSESECVSGSVSESVSGSLSRSRTASVSRSRSASVSGSGARSTYI